MCRSPLFFLLLLFGLYCPAGPLFAQEPNIGFTNSITIGETNQSYGRDIVGRLTEADLLMRKGEWQEALLAIDKALAQLPDWVPGLVSRAEVLTMMGRNAEADQNLAQARQINERAVEVLLSFRVKDPIRFMALFPQIWMSEQLDLPEIEELWIDLETPEYELLEFDYFNAQYNQLQLMPDTVALYEVLRAQLNEEISELPLDIDAYLPDTTDRTLKELIKGNIQLRYRDPNRAIFHYTQAIETGTPPWPELRYNRGLTFIFMNRYSVGCRDLRLSAEEGFRPALDLLTNLCNF